MATDPPESDHRLADESDVPQIGGTELERLHSYYSAEDLKGEIEARDSKLAILSDAAKKREDELRRELARQSRHFAESIGRLQRELQDQIDAIGGIASASWRRRSNTSKLRALKLSAKIIASKRASPGG